MTSERPHVLPRTVGSWGGGRSDAAVPWGTVRSLWNPNPEPGKRQSSRLTGSQSARSGRPGSGVVVVLTPLPGREKAGEAQASFGGLLEEMHYPLQWGWGWGWVMRDSAGG